MSAPTPAPGDESPREGYYPDPSIPGYVRYWNGASWVPGTSRPAPPQDGTAPAPVEETGPVFLDDRPDGEGRPEPATAWQADATRQAGFGGDRDRRVSWGGPGDRARPEIEDGPGTPESADRAPAATTPPAVRAPDPRVPSSNAGRAGNDGRGAPEPAASAPGTRVPSSNAGRAENDGAVLPPQARPAGADEVVQPNQARPAIEDGTGAPGSGERADRAPGDAAPERTVAIRALRRPAGEQPATDGTLTIRALDASPRPSALPAAPTPVSPPQTGSAPGAPWGQQGPVSQPAPAPQAHPHQAPAPAPQAHPHPVPHQAPAPAPQAQPAHQAPAPAPQAQPAHQAPAPAPQAQPAPWKPPVDDHFQRLAAARASGRPAPLGKRFAARLIDSVVLGALTAAAAVPLAARAADHIDDKIDAAKLSGETVTVWLLDSTTAALGGAVLGVFLVLGMLLDALPTAKWGRTLGKKLCGIDVRDMESHEAPGFGAALRRWLVYAVPGLLVVGAAGVLWCLIDRPWRQCWHDKAAGTFVAG
ncbi:RDD family protein [Streptomyces sp. NPDC047803]|uniref:RDD family protein n=1 Tax=Streptomyces sp. NPDC047803 TaxID=3160976 RepID=UPI0034108A80